MNKNFGRDGRYRDDRYAPEEFHREREARERYWQRLDENGAVRSPDQEFETSGPYRQPREPYGEIYVGRESRQDASAYRGASSPERFDGIYAPAYAPEWGAARSGLGSEGPGGYAGRGPKDYKRGDDRIRDDVCERLSWDDQVDATDVEVRVTNGEVTLEGSVETRHMKRLAEAVAERVPGVVDVHNTLRVTRPMLTQLKEKLTGEAPASSARAGVKRAP